MSDDLSALAQFGGVARLFPLPNLVLFPQVMQPLHIFEPRYRQLTTDALDGDRLLALALLRPGWEADYAGRPAIHSIACLGRIAAEQRLDDGRFNLLVRGLSRILLTEEITTDKLYRSARAEFVPDLPGPSALTERKLRRQLLRRVAPWFAEQGAVLEQIRKLLKSSHPLGIVSDILAFALPLEMERKQELLEASDVEQRVRQLLGLMASHPPANPTVPAERPFPPDFSNN